MKRLAFIFCLIVLLLQATTTFSSEKKERKNDRTGYVQMLMMMEAEENAEELLNLKDVPRKQKTSNDDPQDINTSPAKSDQTYGTAKE